MPNLKATDDAEKMPIGFTSAKKEPWSHCVDHALLKEGVSGDDIKKKKKAKILFTGLLQNQ